MDPGRRNSSADLFLLETTGVSQHDRAIARPSHAGTEYHKQVSDQWSELLTRIFDLLVTKTVLPIFTLLLGYLFGKAKSTG
jgi:hypothetical protein